MKQYVLILIIVSAVIAYPEAERGLSLVDLNTAIDKAIIRKITDFLSLIYTTAKEPIQEESLEVIARTIAASFRKFLRQDVANELEDGAYGGSLSQDIMKRIRRQILDFALQYIPNDLSEDITKAMEKQHAIGQANNQNENLAVRINQYVTSFSTKGRRIKREFWSDLIVTVLNVLVDILIEIIEDSIDDD